MSKSQKIDVYITVSYFDGNDVLVDLDLFIWDGVTLVIFSDNVDTVVFLRLIIALVILM